MTVAAATLRLALLAGLAEGALAAPLDPILKRLVREGEEGTLPAPLARQLDLKAGAPVRLQVVEARDTEDHISRAIRIVLDSRGARAKPVSLILIARKDLPREGRSDLYQLRLKPTGELEQLLYGSGRLDAAGNPVRGYWPPQAQEITAPESRLLARRELDFWLRRGSPKKRR